MVQMNYLKVLNREHHEVFFFVEGDEASLKATHAAALSYLADHGLVLLRPGDTLDFEDKKNVLVSLSVYRTPRVEGVWSMFPVVMDEKSYFAMMQLSPDHKPSYRKWVSLTPRPDRVAQGGNSPDREGKKNGK